MYVFDGLIFQKKGLIQLHTKKVYADTVNYIRNGR